MSKQPKSNVSKRPLSGAAARAAAGEKVGGRPKGTPNKVTGDVRRMTLEALEKIGGVDYLVQQARKRPTAFLSLLGRCLPLAVHGELTLHAQHLDERLKAVRLKHAVAHRVVGELAERGDL